jgi:hypothetical protein
MKEKNPGNSEEYGSRLFCTLYRPGNMLYVFQSAPSECTIIHALLFPAEIDPFYPYLIKNAKFS